MSAVSRSEAAERARAEYEAYRGRTIAVNCLHSPDDPTGCGFELDPPAKVRVAGYSEHWSDDEWIDPYWDVDLVEPHTGIPPDAGAFYIWAPSCNIQTGERQNGVFEELPPSTPSEHLNHATHTRRSHDVPDDSKYRQVMATNVVSALLLAVGLGLVGLALYLILSSEFDATPEQYAQLQVELRRDPEVREKVAKAMADGRVTRLEARRILGADATRDHRFDIRQELNNPPQP